MLLLKQKGRVVVACHLDHSLGSMVYLCHVACEHFAANPCDVGVLNVAAFQQVDRYTIQAVDAWSDSPNAGASFCASCQSGSYYSSQGVVT